MVWQWSVFDLFAFGYQSNFLLTLCLMFNSINWEFNLWVHLNIPISIQRDYYFLLKNSILFIEWFSYQELDYLQGLTKALRPSVSTTGTASFLTPIFWFLLTERDPISGPGTFCMTQSGDLSPDKGSPLLINQIISGFRILNNKF